MTERNLTPDSEELFRVDLSKAKPHLGALSMLDGKLPEFFGQITAFRELVLTEPCSRM